MILIYKSNVDSPGGRHPFGVCSKRRVLASINPPRGVGSHPPVASGPAWMSPYIDTPHPRSRDLVPTAGRESGSPAALETPLYPKWYRAV